VAALLAREFRSMEALRTATAETINAVEGIGAVIAEAVTHFFADEKNRSLVDALARSGVQMTEPSDDTGDGPLSGQTYVITGTLSTLSRSKAEGLIKGAGGKVVGNVSKKTTAVLAGADPGSKLDRARTLGIPVIDETELLRRLGEAP
jgi:DNA ligase (NAD+)